MSERLEISLTVDGTLLTCSAGQTVASALLMHHSYLMRRSPNANAPRGPFCMMGACQECAIYIDGAISCACQTEVRDGMQVHLGGVSGLAADCGV